MAPKQKFADGEKVLCFHGPLIYEAKALKSQVTKDKQVKYFIHYAGWNKNWDEWVPESRVLKFNEANIQKQRELAKQHATLAAKNKKAVASKPKKPDSTGSKDSDSRASTPSKDVPVLSANTTATVSSTSRGRASKPAVTPTTTASQSNTAAAAAAAAATAAPVVTTPVTTVTTIKDESVTKDDGPKKKRGRFDQSVETEEQFVAKIEIKVKIPDDLKPWLVDDWHAINRQQKLLDIPAKTTVHDIITAYIQHKKSTKSTNINKELAYTDVTLSLIEYFNAMLGCQLLYKFERPQYSEILEQHPDVPMSKLYGSFHLLRLFVKLGPMVAFTTLDEKSIQLLMVHLQDFLKYMVKNSSTLFSMQHFVNVSSEYHRKVQ